MANTNIFSRRQKACLIWLVDNKHLNEQVKYLMFSVYKVQIGVSQIYVKAKKRASRLSKTPLLDYQLFKNGLCFSRRT